MRTTVLNHFHTLHPEAQAEHDRLAVEEGVLKARIAERDEGEPEVAPRRRMSEPPEDLDGRLAEVQAKMQEHRQAIASGVVRIVVKALTRGEFRRVLTAHPPREDDEYDARVGYNVDTFGDAFIQACILETRAHELLGGETVPNEWDAWADEMTNGQWQAIFTACMELTNDGEPVFPR